MKSITGAVLALAVMLSLSFSDATAQEGPHYTWVEGGYTDVDPDGDLLDSGDGWFAGFSLRLQSFHIFAEYANRSLQGIGTNPDVDQTQILAGGGWQGLMGPTADLVVEAAYVNADVDQGTMSVGDSGYLGQVGVRWKAIPFLELDGYYRYLDVYEESESLYRLQALVWIKRFGIGGTWDKADSGDSFNLFLRYNIGG